MRKTLRVQVTNKVLLLCFCLQVAFYYDTNAQVSGTYTINSTLPTGPGNFHSFTDAVTYMQNGLSGAITFNVVAGTGPYNEQITLDNRIGATVLNTVTFNCNGVTLSFIANNTNNRAGVKLDNASYVTFDNLRITPQAAGLYGYGFHLLNNSDNNIIRNCRVVVPANAIPDNHEGIVINGNHGAATASGTSNCDNNLIQNNTISGGRTGITLNSAPASGAAVLMRNNKVLNNTISDPDSSCIQLNYNDSALVDGNDLQGGPHAINRVAGVYLNLFDQQVKVTNNKIHNFHIGALIWGSFIYGILNSAQGISGKENLFANNLIYDFSSNGIQYGIASRFATASYFNIFNNTISLDDQTIYGQECDGIYFEDVSNVKVWNNIISISRQTSDWNYGITLEKLMPQLSCSRNVYYVSGSDFTNAVGSLANTDLTLLTDWQKATGLDYSSANEDPLFTNLAAFNFIPKAQPIDNMALVVTINTDITGAVRSPLNPDPGCYEFVTPACQTPVVPGSTTVLPDSILCYGPQISLGLQGNSWGVGQTYTWQSASSPTGTYSNVSTGLAYPSADLLPASTLYYRAAVTCLGNTMYSAPIRVIVNTRLSGGTYTINSGQPTGGINFHSFGDAVLAMQCGITGSVVFNVTPGSGPYNEQVILPAITTSATQTVTFRGNGNTLAFAATNSDERAVLKLNGIDYVTIDSLNINVTGSSFGFGIQLMDDADHNTIKRCSVSMATNIVTNGYAGIVINNSGNDPINYSEFTYCDSNTIANNTITGGYYGISYTSRTYIAPSPMPVGNILSGNKMIDNCGFGIYMDGVANTLVDSNDISQKDRTTFTNFSGIYLKQSASFGMAPYGNKITRNRVHNLITNGRVATVEAHGLHFEAVLGNAAAPNIAANNLMYNFRGIGNQYGVYSRSSNNLKVYHNTISLEDSTGTNSASGITAGVGLYGSLTVNDEFKNNSVVIKRGGLGTSTGILIIGKDSALKADHNNYLITTLAGTGYTGSMGGRTYTKLTDWLAVRKDSNSICLYPLYKDSLKADFTPTLIPFDDKGTTVGITNDINNTLRSASKPDIGANEFTVCYPLTEPIVRVDSVGGFVIKFAWSAVENASGYRVSRDGLNWTEPSSGKMGTSHYISGLMGQDTVGLMVEALGTRFDCPSAYSKHLVGQTLSDQIFFPNTFTPNGNGQNDKFKMYSNVVHSMRLLIFNQWGEKVFETADINGSWDGTCKGKPQPIGVYVYVATMELTDGTSQVKKGSFNLLR
ncbi:MULTISPECIES: right-handed parallel beta-helix repeat-containing protein [Niastella]|uniref:Right-handed parallel beta-helix repeat-containing protein n=1 Tax=Niastella soli TaxID=2821487 RepID=A0ABS3YW19_9BACT|nr:gliding motility-associated C-terminal domain-containing protein [Niastella soli]MBO9202126.1 right-handed parallel beta-helix repeat-containing protein [Niastella soli]